MSRLGSFSVNPKRNFLLFAVLLLVGCQREQISVYRVPKETNQFLALTPHARLQAGPQRDRPGIRWQNLPADWKEATATNSMRVAGFVIKGENGRKLEVSVTPLVGAAGIETESLNMWCGELGLAPLDNNGAKSAGEKVAVGDVTGTLYEFEGTKENDKARIIGAVLERNGATWFFKMTGPDALVAQQKSAFANFLKTISFVDASPTMASSAPGKLAGDVDSDAPVKPKWAVPAHWQQQPPKSMLIAAFSISDAANHGEVTVSAFPGEVGGLAANVNRWRGQLGLAPVGEKEIGQLISSTDVNGERGTVVDLKNEQAQGGPKRILAVILSHGGKSWFFKLSGPEELVSKEKPGFIKFVQSVRFPENA